MKKVIVGISAAAAVVGGFFYFAWYRSGEAVPAAKEVRHHAACGNKGTLHPIYRGR
jgi:hypothetical protein